mgnify:CR=1 FL=1
MSFLFVCRSCGANARLVQKDGRAVYVPDDFDYLCEDCHAREHRDVEGTQGEGAQTIKRGRQRTTVSDRGDAAGKAVPAATQRGRSSA